MILTSEEKREVAYIVREMMREEEKNAILTRLGVVSHLTAEQTAEFKRLWEEEIAKGSADAVPKRPKNRRLFICMDRVTRGTQVYRLLCPFGESEWLAVRQEDFDSVFPDGNWPKGTLALALPLMVWALKESEIF